MMKVIWPLQSVCELTRSVRLVAAATGGIGLVTLQRTRETRQDGRRQETSSGGQIRSVSFRLERRGVFGAPVRSTIVNRRFVFRVLLGGYLQSCGETASTRMNFVENENQVSGAPLLGRLRRANDKKPPIAVHDFGQRAIRSSRQQAGFLFVRLPSRCIMCNDAANRVKKQRCSTVLSRSSTTSSLQFTRRRWEQRGRLPWL
jgi:hypothetical protein